MKNKIIKTKDCWECADALSSRGRFERAGRLRGRWGTSAWRGWRRGGVEGGGAASGVEAEGQLERGGVMKREAC